MGKNFGWIYLERFIQQIISFVVTVVIARVVSPEAYGTVALVMVFIALANVFVEGGFGTALVQKKEADDVDFSSTLIVSVIVSVILYLIIWFLAPALGEYYNDAYFAKVIRILGLRIIVGAINTVQQAFISRTQSFRISFFVSSVTLLISAVLALLLAYKGGGVWALVLLNLVSISLSTIVFFVVLEWKPKLIFSLQSIHSIFSFGGKMLVSNLLDAIYNNLRNLVIGRRYTSADLAFYSKGDQFPQVVVTAINSSIGKLLLPVMSKEQDSRNQIKEYTRLAVRLSSFIMAPLLIGMSVCSKDIVLLVLTDAWLKSVPIMNVLCFMYLFYPIHTANLQAIIAMGKSDVYLRLEIIKKSIGVLCLFATIQLFDTVEGMAVSALVTSVICIFINAAPNIEIIGYLLKEQAEDILPSIIIASIMGALVWLCGLFFDKLIIRLIVKVCAGIVIYTGFSLVFNKKCFVYVMDFIKEKKERKK